ncbi:MAG: hypothetical protein JXR44_04305 [Thiotrichales bacterium]|nr:hypothetical protein [Thiotrichales bacterium]
MLTITKNLTLGQLASKPSELLLNTLRVGQTLNAQLEKIEGQNVTLKLGQITVNATSKESGLTPGPVQLTVKQTHPSLILALSPPPSAKDPQTVLPTALRLHLSQQQPLNQITVQLNQLLTQLPSHLQAPLNALLENLRKPLVAQTGSELKQLLENSGLFLENKLAQATPPANIKSDLKAQLLQFQQLLQSNPSMQDSDSALKLAHKLTEQAISKITLGQLQLYENPALSRFDFLTDSQPLIEERLSFAKKQSPNGNTRWEVLLNLQTEQGELRAKLSLLGQQQLYCGIWCADPELGARWQNEFNALKPLLLSLDFEQVELQLLNQPPVEENSSPQRALIDIRI